MLDLDYDEISGFVFVDYKKVFDLIDYDIFLFKFKEYGVIFREFFFLMNYLKGRRSVVVIILMECS